MRLRCARASLRSSCDMSVRGRLREGADWGAGESRDDEEEEAAGEGAARAAGSMNAAGIVLTVLRNRWGSSTWLSI